MPARARARHSVAECDVTTGLPMRSSSAWIAGIASKFMQLMNRPSAESSHASRENLHDLLGRDLGELVPLLESHAAHRDGLDAGLLQVHPLGLVVVVRIGARNHHPAELEMLQRFRRRQHGRGDRDPPALRHVPAKVAVARDAPQGPADRTAVGDGVDGHAGQLLHRPGRVRLHGFDLRQPASRSSMRLVKNPTSGGATRGYRPSHTVELLTTTSPILAFHAS